MASNPYVNKVQKADGTTIIDISDTTATASDCASGKYLYLASGQKVQGSATGGGSYVTQDADGRVILPPVVGTATTTTKTITQGGVYNASDDNVTGYSQVTINVAGVTIGTKTKNASNATSISFTGLAKEPEVFFVSPNGSLSASSSTYFQIGVFIDVRYNGTDVCASYARNGYVLDADVSFTYSSGTLTITYAHSYTYFDGTYKLTYIY